MTNLKYLVRGLNRDGSVERFYTGRAGRKWLGSIDEAFVYDTEDAARRKAKLFNTREPLTGFYFVSRPICEDDL